MKAANEFYWVLLLIISVLGLLGVIFLCIGTALYAREKRKRASCTQQVIASVTDIQHRAIGTSGYTDADEVKMMSWFPVYEYSVQHSAEKTSICRNSETRGIRRSKGQPLR